MGAAASAYLALRVSARASAFGGSGYLASGRSQNWIKSGPLAIMRQKSTRHAAGDGGGCSKCSDQNGQQAPGTAVLRFRWCRFRSQCCTRGYAQGRELGVDQSAAALWLSSNHSWPAVFPLAEGVEDRSIAWRVFRRMVPMRVRNLRVDLESAGLRIQQEAITRAPGVISC